MVLDRTFVDKQGVRWIIDYKIAKPPESNPKAWLLQQVAQYKLQLQRYQSAWKRFDSSEVRYALYFLGIARFVEVDLGD